MSLSKYDPNGLTAHGVLKRRKRMRRAKRKPRDRKVAGFLLYACLLAGLAAASCSHQVALRDWLQAVVG